MHLRAKFVAAHTGDYFIDPSLRDQQRCLWRTKPVLEIHLEQCINFSEHLIALPMRLSTGQTLIESCTPQPCTATYPSRIQILSTFSSVKCSFTYSTHGIDPRILISPATPFHENLKIFFKPHIPAPWLSKIRPFRSNAPSIQPAYPNSISRSLSCSRLRSITRGKSLVLGSVMDTWKRRLACMDCRFRSPNCGCIGLLFPTTVAIADTVFLVIMLVSLLSSSGAFLQLSGDQASLCIR